MWKLNGCVRLGVRGRMDEAHPWWNLVAFDSSESFEPGLLSRRRCRGSKGREMCTTQVDWVVWGNFRETFCRLWHIDTDTAWGKPHFILNCELMTKNNVLGGSSSYCRVIDAELVSCWCGCLTSSTGRCKSKLDKDCLQVSLCERMEVSSLDWTETVSSWVDTITWDAEARGAPCSGSAKTSDIETGAYFLCFSCHEGWRSGFVEQEGRRLDGI